MKRAHLGDYIPRMRPLLVTPFVTAALGTPFPLLVEAAGWLSRWMDSPWAYWVLGASAILAEELSPIFGGIAASEGHLRAMSVVTAITIGGWVATTLLYLVGFWRWEWIRRRFPRTRATGTVALRVVRRNPLKASFFVRFAFGLRIVLPLAAGAARVPFYIYLPVSLLGSLAWTAVYTVLGYAAGGAAITAMGHLSRMGEAVGAILLTIAVVLFLRWRRARAERKAARRRDVSA